MSDVSLAFGASPGLTPHFQERLDKIWREKFQFRHNPLEGLFMVDNSLAGHESARYDIANPIDETTAVNDITARSAQGDATVAADMTGSQRIMTGKIFDLAERYSQWDQHRLGQLGNPQNMIWKEMQNAVNRKNVRYLLSKMGADVQAGNDENGDALPAHTFPTAQVVDVDFVDNGGIDGTGSSSTFNLDKFDRIARQFTENQVYGQDVMDPETMPVIACTTDDIRQLKRDERVISRDYNGQNIDVLFTGQLKQWGGFRFLLIPKSIMGDTAGVRSIWAWVPSAFCFYRGDSLMRVSELPTNRYKVQLYNAWRVGLMRLHDEGVMRCDVLVSDAA